VELAWLEVGQLPMAERGQFLVATDSESAGRAKGAWQTAALAVTRDIPPRSRESRRISAIICPDSVLGQHGGRVFSRRGPGRQRPPSLLQRATAPPLEPARLSTPGSTGRVPLEAVLDPERAVADVAQQPRWRVARRTARPPLNRAFLFR
jgi:hypothetical protein